MNTDEDRNPDKVKTVLKLNIKPITSGKVKRPQTGIPSQNSRNRHVGTIYYKTYCQNNNAWVTSESTFKRT
jgi:hypothetical protein